MSRPDRLDPLHVAFFASLYAIQGVVIAYFFNYNQLYMGAAGVPIDRIGLVQTLATIPFSLKFLGGILSDRVDFLGLGHRKPYIVLGLLAQSAGLVALTVFHPKTQAIAFLASAVFAVSGLALYDTCCDGMVILVTPTPDRERVQGILVAARFLAAMVCSKLFGAWLQKTGNGPGHGDGVLYACAAMALVPLALAALVPEPTRTKGASFEWAALGALIRPRAVVLLAFGLLYATVGYGVEINLSPYYTGVCHFGSDDVGNFAAARYVGRAVGGLLLPLAVLRLGRPAVLAIGVLALAGSSLGQLAVGGSASAACWGFAFGAANGWDDALFAVLAMEASDPRMAASTYALFNAVGNLSVLGGFAFAKVVERSHGDYGPAFRLACVAALVALPMTIPLARPAPKRPSHAEPLDELLV
ncbi:MAG TPA: MFS transporter [Isosphaeraceae bacterium]|jgi:PAT family beta-lactamase induction signal transducer AmpG|nr:MFS transporter [Isosphaeraceae bacterium]